MLVGSMMGGKKNNNNGGCLSSILELIILGHNFVLAGIIAGAVIVFIVIPFSIGMIRSSIKQNKQTAEKELELLIREIIHLHRKRQNAWQKRTLMLLI